MLPERVEHVEQLEELLSRPTPRAVETLRETPGDLLILGAGGKMGPTLARMAVRASEAAGHSRRVLAVSRFSDPAVRDRLQACGVETIPGDLLERRVLKHLPDAPNVIFMAGMKFGATDNQPLTWAMNTHLPALVCERFPTSRIVALSTGNVYGLVDHSGGGSREADPLNPTGEYAMSCLGRERIFQYFSRLNETPGAIVRLNYAVELRYGVLVDLAQRIYAGEPIDLGMSYVNVIWQGDACASILCTLAECTVPPRIVNIAGQEIVRVRDICEQLARRAGCPVRFTGQETDTALLNDGSAARVRHGAPTVPLERLLDWTVDWVVCGGTTLGKPTHFEVRDGDF
jgi:nucleoside-diphosphate-sugar epimerase